MKTDRFEVESPFQGDLHYVDGPWELLPEEERPENVDPERGVGYLHYYDAITAASRWNVRIGKGGL